MAFEIDQQIRKIIDECYKEAEKVVRENKKLVDLIAENLIKYETLTQEQIEYLVKYEKMPNEDYEKMSLEELKKIAHDRGIKGYTKMTKEELKEELGK